MTTIEIFVDEKIANILSTELTQLDYLDMTWKNKCLVSARSPFQRLKFLAL